MSRLGRELLDLSAAERAHVARLRASPCRNGHDRSAARIHRTASGQISLPCPHCVAARVRRFRQGRGGRAAERPPAARKPASAHGRVRQMQARLDRAFGAAPEPAIAPMPLLPGEYEFRVHCATGVVYGTGVRVAVT